MIKMSEMPLEELEKMKIRAKERKMPCTEKDCRGILDFNQEIPIPTNCNGLDTFYPCNTCGRVHDDDNNPVIDKHSREKLFMVNGVIELRKE